MGSDGELIAAVCWWFSIYRHHHILPTRAIGSSKRHRAVCMLAGARHACSGVGGHLVSRVVGVLPPSQ